MEKSNNRAISPPQTYLFEWSNNGWGFGRKNADIVQLLEPTTSPGPSGSELRNAPSFVSTTSTLVQDVKSDGSFFKMFSPSPSTDDKPEGEMSTQTTAAAAIRGDQVYHVRHLKWSSKSYELFEGPSPPPVSDEGSGEKSGDGGETGRKLMDIQQEGCWDCKSTYTNADAKTTVMSKFKGEGGEPFWSVNRSFNDFDGVHYKIQTGWFDDLTITRTEDKMVIARFDRTKFTIHEIGKLTILAPVTPSFLHLLLSTTFMKYLQDRTRRQQVGAPGTGGKRKM
ncbi:hypothetical protein FRB94_001703 [Tulasnella sp. JGI-2019a]|nr:hypothetical protein FRB94_001703 [Tulasnella sp. JGI-2019a]